MGMITQWLNKKNIIKWLRWLHRDLGYFVVGIALVYAISGILLNHRNDKDPAYTSQQINTKFPAQLNPGSFRSHWESQGWEYQLNKIIARENHYQLCLKGGLGSYNAQTGEVSFDVYKKRPFISFINKLHYNQEKGWTFFADFFAVSLIFLAISGLFIVQGKNGFLRRGVWIMIAGIVVVVIYFWK
jgi:uncharacterized protein